MPTIIQFIFNAYSIDADLEVNSNLLNLCLKNLQICQENELSESILKSLVLLLRNTNKFEIIQLPGLLIICELFFLKQYDFDAFEFQRDTIKSLKFTLKSNLKNNPTLTQEITQHFQNSKEQMIKFQQLIK